ncbi:MAG: flagellar biosynthesis protein FlhB [Gemmataceae bacterium]
MAEEDLGQTKTEEPTPRRREEAREQGQVAFSNDLTTGLLMLLGLGSLAAIVPGVAIGLIEFCRGRLGRLPVDGLTPERVQEIFGVVFDHALEWLGFFFGVVVVGGVLVSVLQVGFYFAPGLLGFNFEKLSPANGWSKLFSLGGGVRGLAALLKVAAIALVAFWVMSWRGIEIGELGAMRLGGATARAWSTVTHLALAVAGSLVVLGLADYFFQRWRHDQSLRMTRQELKEELKREDGDPQIKARVRKLQREAAQKQMMKDVPKATVVVTNPTHLAIALRYAPNERAAPTVVAKGAGAVAQRIIAVARQHGVSVVEKKPLAQALFKTVKIGQEIPAALYLAVAEVIAYVFRLRGTTVAAPR